MCEPITITAITTATTTAIASASAAASAAAASVAAAATSAATAVTGVITSAASALGIGGAAGGAGAGGGGISASAASLGTSLGGSSLSIGSGAGAGGSLIAPLAPIASGSLLVGELAVAPTLATGLTLTEGVALAGLVGGAVSSTVTGVQQTERNKQQVKDADRDAGSKRIAALQSAQQGAEASAQQQFEAQRAALQAKGVVKASNLGDRSVRAISRAVGFELGQSEATISRNQEIASLETSGRLFGINQQRDARVGQVGSGLTVGLNAAAGGIRAGARALEIRNRLSN